MPWTLPTQAAVGEAELADAFVEGFEIPDVARHACDVVGLEIPADTGQRMCTATPTFCVSGFGRIEIGSAVDARSPDRASNQAGSRGIAQELCHAKAMEREDRVPACCHIAPGRASAF